jgi:hypothetical protein
MWFQINSSGTMMIRMVAPAGAAVTAIVSRVKAGRATVPASDGPAEEMKTLFCVALLAICVLAIYGTRSADCSGNQRMELRSSAHPLYSSTFQTQTLALRGGTDWSDDSAGITRARLRMKKPDSNVTETGNTTEANSSGSNAQSEE